MEIPPHPSWVCIITFSSSSANMAIAIAVVKGEEEATPGGLAGTTMMTTDHTHRHPGDTAQDHHGTVHTYGQYLRTVYGCYKATCK